MSISIKPADKAKFIEQVINRQRQYPNRPLHELATELNDHYRSIDKEARSDFVNKALRMFANYENRWMGEVSNGRWQDTTPQGSNNVYFTVPLLTAHVDSHTTFYTRVRPKYIAKPFVKTHLNSRLAEMCEEVGNNELGRMLKPSLLQHEAQNIALATVSYRQIVMDYQPHSPTVMEQKEDTLDEPVEKMMCNGCQEEFESEPGSEPQCPNEGCMSDDISSLGTGSKQTIVKTQIPVRLQRPTIRVPNPVSVQDDFSAATFNDSRFIITRRKISRKEAEYYYQIDLSDGFDNSSEEAQAQYRMERETVGPQQPGRSTFSFPDYQKIQNEQVEEVRMWLSPCEYGLYFVDGALLQTKYPTGMFIHIAGNKLVEERPSDKSIEWIRVQQGVRPVSNKGMGMSHLADLNDAINNSISLDYSILRTHGFPIRLLRGKWLSMLPQANQTLVMDKIPEDRNLAEAIHTEQPSNTSGLLGIITQKFQGFMQYVGGSLNPMGMPTDMKDMMGSATGASAIQEMMSDRMGLSIQMRVEADIETMYAILTLLQRDKLNRQYFLDGGYDESVVNAFFKTDFRSMFYLEPAKGTDEPRMDSVNTFKVQSFASLTASLTGLRQFDQDTFYDIVAALGDTLNIDVSVGAGRSERNLADNRISRIIELYNDQKELPDTLEIDAVTFGTRLFQAVTMKEKLWMEAIIRSQIPPPPDIPDAVPSEQAIMMMMQAQEEAQQIAARIEVYLYDYDALVETYTDWLQSDAGQNADIAITVAVGLLYAYCAEQRDRKKQMEAAAAMEQAVMAESMINDNKEGSKASNRPKDDDDKKADNPPGPLKRDGSTGPGRPKNVKVDKPPE